MYNFIAIYYILRDQKLTDTTAQIYLIRFYKRSKAIFNAILYNVIKFQSFTYKRALNVNLPPMYTYLCFVCSYILPTIHITRFPTFCVTTIYLQTYLIYFTLYVDNI
jgi:hypothetical protein